MTSFADLGVRPRTLTTLNNRKIVVPQPVQEQAIPPLLQGRDCVISAPTGSGKTLAFMIPAIERLQGTRHGLPRALMVTPTRELATQLAAVLKEFDGQLRCALIYGGVGYRGQISALRNADVIIGCPGRLVDLHKQGVARYDAVEYLVLDEADEMLDQGFARDVETIMSLTPQRGSGISRQTVLASATMPSWVQRMIERHLVDPARVRIESTAEDESLLEHGIVQISHGEKVPMLSRLLQHHQCSTIVFHRTKHGVTRLARDLARLGHHTAELQGNLSQNARDRALNSFRRGTTNVLVATNVAARGLDISDVGLVVNYELPDTADALTHRVGRTARNGARGRALTFFTENDTEQWRKLRRLGAPELQIIDTQYLFAEKEFKFVGIPAMTDAASGYRPRLVGRYTPRRRFGRPASGRKTA